jgi:hypothetical protein
MTDSANPGRRRPGGQPKSKDQKRIAMSLRLSPALHTRLVARAKEHGRSITQQAEMLLDQALSAGVIREEINRVEKALDEMGNRLDQELAAAHKQRNERETEQRNILRHLDDMEARFLAAREIEGKRKP